jgi:hypothetical protein
MPREYGTHLYIILAGEVCKIGRSMDVQRRFAEVSRAKPFSDCRLVATFHGAGFVEPWVLRALCEYERRSEWFRCTPADALAAVGLRLV